MTARRVERSVLPALANRDIVVPVAATHPLEQAVEAYDSFAGRGKFGKIVLLP
jgi:NADPH:quinone reductase-like Zn-dependent oxidoreductase